MTERGSRSSTDNPDELVTGARPTRTSLIVVGRFGTGKTTTCRLLSQLTGLPYIEIGALVREQAALRGLDALTHAADQFAEGNTLAFVESVVTEAEMLGIPCIVGGPRRIDELRYLQIHLAPAFSVALTLPDDERWRRLTRRRVTEDRGQEWSERDATEEAWGIADAVAACDERLSSPAPAKTVAEECLAMWLAYDSTYKDGTNAS